VTLKKLVYTCDAASKMDTTGIITSFEDKENFAPGKKMELPVILLDARKERTYYSMSMVNNLFTYSILIITNTQTCTHTRTHTQSKSKAFGSHAKHSH